MENYAVTSKHILLAEDDLDDTFFFIDIVKEISSDIIIHHCKDGIELMNKLNTDIQPSIIFLDIKMPHKNGFQCIAEIRASEKHKKLPVAVLSSSGSDDIISIMYEAGANNYIKKPNDYKVWKIILEKVLKMDWNQYTPLSNRKYFLLTEK